ncbi:hypothetical protein [Albibacterium bauzanense]|uniref:Uncharacterized protein n=1 Tax=Albibacterium bauzanense TaxID=653929 RepID=A0A4R1LVN2_9SPHI|nr:hypothetical protein [Albibacterium bauzanense]TCK82912.1 hypothetical protein C8N28_1499 [Albibacterium bauzanense]
MASDLPISTLIKILERDYFNENWISENNFEPESKSLITNKIIKAATEILSYYILFFLSGEYCRLIEDKERNDYLGQLEKYLHEVANQIDIKTHPAESEELQLCFSINIIQLFNNYIKPPLVYLTRDLENQFSIDRKKKLVRAIKITTISKSFDEEVQDYLKGFDIILWSTNIEHFNYHLNPTVLRNFLLYQKESSELKIDEVLKKAIISKINFLLVKLLYRNITQNNEDEEVFFYSFNQEEDESLSIDNIELDKKLQNWSDVIDIHYNFHADYKNEQRKRVNLIYEKVRKNYTYGDYHALIKIYKDDYKNEEQIDNLFNDINEIKPVSSFEKYAKKISTSYVFNNRISFLCGSKNGESGRSEYYRELFYTIKNHQNNNFIRNFFPWLKLGITLSKRIDKLSDNLLNEAMFREFKVLLGLLEDTVRKLEEAFQWSEYKKFIPFQMSFEECHSDYIIYDTKYGDFNLFIFSSYLLPLNYKNVRAKKDDLHLKKVKYDALVTVYEKLEKVVDKVNEESEKMRKHERRSVEILAIFSAVALFSIGSLQVFSQEPVYSDPHIYYRFILSYGYSLCLFVLLIWIITRDNILKVHWVHWIIISLIVISSFLVIGYVVNYPQGSVQSVLNKEEPIISKEKAVINKIQSK